MRNSPLLVFLIVAVEFACSSTGSSEPAPPVPPPAATTPTVDDPGASASITIAPDPQRPGDPAKGYRALVNEPYVPCGVPLSLYPFGAPKPEDQVEGREGDNAKVRWDFNTMTTKDGVKLAVSNCLACHAGRLDGKLVVGLGNATGDFTSDPSGTADLGGAFLSDPKEKAEWAKWKARIDVIGPYSVLSTVGPNPADGFTAALFAHHDPKTMAWSDTPLMSIPAPVDLPVDVPPWWNMKKKASMFYVGGGRGDHARIMMTASILCTSSVEESRAIDAYFPDVRAYIETLEAPKYTRSIDASKAAAGKTVFERTCARCHGTYGAGGQYPNKLVLLDEIGTDGLLAGGAAQFDKPLVDWFNGSFFGEIARFEPQRGYVAPPLDGIWATAPYFHNGSVPTLAGVLESSARPTYWTWSFDTHDFDETQVGWKFSALDHGKKAEPDANKKPLIYDTTIPGYGNGGHTYGDALSADERAQVIDYLKTL